MGVLPLLLPSIPGDCTWNDGGEVGCRHTAAPRGVLAAYGCGETVYGAGFLTYRRRTVTYCADQSQRADSEGMALRLGSFRRNRATALGVMGMGGSVQR